MPKKGGASLYHLCPVHLSRSPGHSQILTASAATSVLSHRYSAWRTSYLGPESTELDFLLLRIGGGSATPPGILTRRKALGQGRVGLILETPPLRPSSQILKCPVQRQLSSEQQLFRPQRRAGQLRASIQPGLGQKTLCSKRYEAWGRPSFLGHFHRTAPFLPGLQVCLRLEQGLSECDSVSKDLPPCLHSGNDNSTHPGGLL